ncbi:DUF3800 domain-containing protein [Bradyrhizobium sp. BR 1433]|uniref:DUF3800 domain-containing protein n=1 Tax=Bradyrhizobium sp. BR 1433 TaxID=3447967 RepID=UPI003EE794FC
MSDLTKPPPYSYIACIDEAGDPGIRRVRPLDPGGGSEWFVLGCSLIQVKSESHQVDWVRKILDELRMKQQTVLHFRDLDEWRKPIACQLLGGINAVRCFAMLSNKTNMKGHRNLRAASRSEGIGIDQVFYNWCLRIILERVTDFVYRHSIRAYGEPRHVKIILGERGTHSYARATWYGQMLKDQSKAGTTYLSKRTINWEVFDSRLIQVSQPQVNAGLQLADIIASSFFQGVDILPPTIFNTHNARLLKPRIAEKDGVIENFGVTLLPFKYYEAHLQPEQIDLLEYYGFHRSRFHTRR